MTVSRADRRKAREPRVLAVFGTDRTPRALDLLLSEGRLDRLIVAARLAVSDWRDLKVAAEDRRRLP